MTVSVASRWSDSGRPGSGSLVILFLAGLVAGGAWHLLNPRDPATRLTGLPMILAVLTVFFSAAHLPEHGAQAALTLAAILGVGVGVLGTDQQVQARVPPDQR